ncbi:MAG: FadR family transcriptional regulator [Roseibium sp.]|uniref:FadR/GntR family transcriptional regulator n=1 Tax=Roseibium sp. TaxID=1936156 RepID=UPI001B154F8E|nr:FCD domain-containing protein [Roseibium sp.]MBO6892610.1 FadR family transcriptional regulator [Roseibium sp.]MBO6928260.1 FadR family transcriptional regulator [Roseibium sp.]
MSENAQQKRSKDVQEQGDEPRDVPHALIKLIEDEGLQVGDRLPPELELVRRLGFGRSTIRETLKTWESMGVVSRNKGAGTRLTAEIGRNTLRVALTIKHEAESLLRMQQVRRPLEVEAVRFATRLATPEQRRLIKARAAELMAVYEAGEDWRPADHRFHKAIHEATGNSLFDQIIEQIMKCFHDIYETPFGKPHLGQDTIPLHQPLADAIIAGEEDRAAVLSARIIDMVCEETQKIMEECDE